MMKCRFKCAALFALCAFSLSEAAAQPADVLRRLHAKYDRVTQFDDGLARVSKNSRHGYVDTLGKVVVPLVYDNAVCVFTTAMPRSAKAGTKTGNGR